MTKYQIIIGEIREGITTFSMFMVLVCFITSIAVFFVSINLALFIMILGYVFYAIFVISPDKEYDKWKWQRDYGDKMKESYLK